MSKNIDMHNIVTINEASNIIESMMNTIIKTPEFSRSLPPIMLRGAPGVGKSTIVRTIAEKLNIGFIDIRLAQMEPVDLRGLPVPKHDDKSVEWYVTSDLPRDPDSKGIILFDELTSADRSLQVAAYELILDRRLGNLYKLPDGWFIVAAGNRSTDRAVATTMSSALANRLMHFDIDGSDAESWINWAITNNIHPSVTGYIRYRPMNLLKMDSQNSEYGWPSPRSWERVSNIISLFEYDENILRKAVYGLIGNAVGIEFMEFYRINKKFDDVLMLMLNPNSKINIPEKSDMKYAMASAVNYLVWNGSNENETKERVDGMFRICMEFNSDFAVMIIKNAMLGNNKITKAQAISYIIKSKYYAKFSEKFGNSKKLINKYKI